MLGALIGDIVGSRFEANNNKSKYFELFDYECSPTDDSYMTIAVAKSLLEMKDNPDRLAKLVVKNMQEIGRRYPYAGYGGRFYDWLFEDEPYPYGSWGNGAAMRISPVGFYANTEEEVKELSRIVTEVTHNHEEGIKGAEATAMTIFMARQHKTKEEIEDYVNRMYYNMNFSIDEIRDYYVFDESCQGTVPVAIKAFLESTDFEDAIRTAISVGGDSDTIGAITGGIANAYYGVPGYMYMQAMQYFDSDMADIITDFLMRYQM